MTSRDQWKALAARCAEAKGPDREIDWLILQAIGWRRVKEGHPFGWVVYDGDQRANQILPNLTASLDAIVSLIEKTLPGYDWRVGKTPSQYDAQLYYGVEGDSFDEDAPTPALALCVAYCLARAELAKEGGE